MENSEIIIIGAGAAGLMAARNLSSQGCSVTILEARDRTGGRIHTIQDSAFDLPVELGAEFVHGDLEVTLKLMREAGIRYHEITGDLWRAENGKLFQQDGFIEGQDKVIEKLKELETDTSVNAFLENHFSGEQHEDLRKSMTSFVEGYDAADADQASSFALLQELVAEDSGDQYRVKDGYTMLINFLEKDCIQKGCRIHLATIVRSVQWQAGSVTITTTDNRTFSSSKCIVSVPVAVLQARPGDTGHLSVDPLPVKTHDAIHALGNTGVIKIILQFRTPFWKNLTPPGVTKKDPEIGFVFGDTNVPTWWTQLPEDNAMITGWLAGKVSLRFKDATDTDLLKEAIQSLSKIFAMEESDLRALLIAHHVVNWTNDPFTRGAYIYEKVGSAEAKRTLNEPLGQTLFFAGEGVYEGPERGTVEAALKTGIKVASMILQGRSA